MATAEQKRSLVGSTAVMALVTLVSRIFGLVREQVKAHLLGTTMAGDAFSTAFIIPNLLRRLVGEGAMTAAFIPVFTDELRQKRSDEVWHFAESFFVAMTALLALVAVLGALASPAAVRYGFGVGYAAVPGKVELTVFLTQLMFPYISLVGLAAVAQAVLNTHRRFAVPAATPILLNLATILCAYLFADRFETRATGFAIGVLVGGFLQLAFQLPFLWSLGMRFRSWPNLRHPAIGRVLRLMVPGLFGVGIYQINAAVSQALASQQVAGAVSALQYSSRILELVLGVFVVSLATVALPELSRQAADADQDGMAATSIFALRLVAFVTIPATVGTILLQGPLVDLLFRFRGGSFDAESSALTGAALTAHMLGLTFIGGVRLVVNVFFAMKDTATPVVAAGVAMMANIALCVALPPLVGHAGIAAANSAAALVQLLILAALVRRRLPTLHLTLLAVPLARVGVATAAMGLAVAGISGRLVPAFEAGKLACAGGIAVTLVLASAVFVGVCTLTGATEPRELAAVLRRRRGGVLTSPTGPSARG